MKYNPKYQKITLALFQFIMFLFNWAFIFVSLLCVLTFLILFFPIWCVSWGIKKIANSNNDYI